MITRRQYVANGIGNKGVKVPVLRTDYLLFGFLVVYRTEVVNP